MRSQDSGLRSQGWRSAFFALLLPALALAQDQMKPRAPSVFLEKAYFSLATPTGKNLAFEGQPTVHYFFANGLGDEIWQKNGGVVWAFPVSAMLQVRMFNSYSMPVKTPSYRIRPLYAQRFSLSRPKGDPLAFVLSEIGLQFTHYSNGQRGCTYQGFTFDAAKETCNVTNAALAAQRKTNVEDGDFSTSYFALDWHQRRGTLGGIGKPVAASWTFGAEVQIHPLEIPPGGMNGDQARDWGQHQVTLAVEREKRRPILWWTGVARLAVEGTYRFGGGGDRRNDSAQIEGSFMPDGAHQVGFFARVHVGADYYNVNYQDRRGFVAGGLVWDLNRMDKMNTGLPD